MTKKEAVERHRKMWSWIANQCERGNEREIKYLKNYYFENVLGINYSLYNCILCDYVGYKGESKAGLCEKCPVLWGSEKTNSVRYCCSVRSPYKQVVNLDVNEKEKRVELCRKIANLPEKVEEDET